jgi:hypothetical protein
MEFGTRNERTATMNETKNLKCPFVEWTDRDKLRAENERLRNRLERAVRQERKRWNDLIARGEQLRDLYDEAGQRR